MSEERPALDPSFLDGLRRMGMRSGKDMIARMADLFEDTHPKLDELEALLTEGNAAEIRETAHFLKGSARAVFAKELQDVCYDLEIKGRDGELEGSEDLMPKIRKEWRRVSEAFAAARAADKEAAQKGDDQTGES